MNSLENRVIAIKKALEIAAAPNYPAPLLIAVTKTVPPEIINNLINTGVCNIGENRVQEILEKYPLLDTNFRIHLIGRLQTNKVKYIIDKVCMIHSLDRIALALEIHKQALRKNTRMPVLIQVNIAGEEQKAGIAPQELRNFLVKCAELSGIAVKGIMAMMPLNADSELLKTFFNEMRKLFEELRQNPVQGISMDELSMGMSQDYTIAAHEGATMVRIGSALFQH